MLKTIANFDEGFWKTLLKKYFLDGYSVTVSELNDK